MDARTLVPMVQQMVDQCIPIAETSDIENDWTVTLYVKRRGTEVVVDANISVRQPKKVKP